MTQKRTLFKNLACLSFCLFTFFMASIFVSQTYFNRVINDQIQELALLKTVHFEDWGKLSTPSPVIHKFQPYVYDENGNSSLYNQSLKYQYTFKYDNFSFTQGNTGNIRYLNNWKREVVPSQDMDKVYEQKIDVFNVEAEKVYNYDYYAPDIRRFALTYNIVFDMLVKQFLPEFYALYIHEYIFKNQSLVQARVFDPMGITKQTGDQIYKHERLGLDSGEKIAKWIRLGNQVDDDSIYTSETYQSLIGQLGLTESQIMYIAGPKSTIQGLLHAVKGIITAKLNDIDSDYCGDDLDDDGFCTSQKIVAAQLGVGVLTSQQLFPTVIINKAIDQLNTTLFNTIEYRTFCDNRPELTNCSGDSDTSAMGFFGNKFLTNYTQVAYIFKNLDKPQTIEETYDIKDKGPAMVAYIKFLYEKTFNLVLANMQNAQKQSPKVQTKQSTSHLEDDGVNVEAFKRSFTNYNHIQKVLDRFKSILNIELYSRAFYNRFISTAKPKCEDYYTGDFDVNKDDCQGLPLASLDDVRVYMIMFLGGSSQKFTNESTIHGEMLYQFFHNPQKSLFAKQAHQLAQDLAAQYNCSSKKMCSGDELFYLQWKSGSVLKNLPSPKYFPSKESKITDWDSQNLLKGVSPQLFNFITVSDQVNPSQILNSKTGIYSLFNLMKVYQDRDGSIYAGISNSQLLQYLQTVVMDVQFAGIYTEQTFADFFNTHKSQIIEQKRQMDPQLGGAPWLSPNISVLKLQNKPQRFNYINSGIYNTQKLRSLSMVEDNLYSSSVYQVFESEWQDVSVTYTNANKIRGTNLFGFQTKIEEHDSIEGYFDMIYQAQVLNYVDTVAWMNTEGKEITAYRFELGGTKSFNITVEELTNKVVQLKSDTYFIVQPNTGLTLQMYIKYTVYSRPFYASELGNKSSSLYPLYQGEIYFINGKTSAMVEISDDQHTLKVLLLLGIIFSSVFLVMFIVMLVLYRKSRKDKFKEENRSLISAEAGSAVGMGLD